MPRGEQLQASRVRLPTAPSPQPAPHLAQKPQPGQQGTAGLSSSRAFPGTVGAPPLQRPYSWDRCWWEGGAGSGPSLPGPRPPAGHTSALPAGGIPAPAPPPPHRTPTPPPAPLWAVDKGLSWLCSPPPLSVLCPALVTLSLTFHFVSDFHPQIGSQSPKPVWVPWGCPALCWGRGAWCRREAQALHSWAPGGSGLLG